jgi:hypothetical protein
MFQQLQINRGPLRTSETINICFWLNFAAENLSDSSMSGRIVGDVTVSKTSA